MSRFIRFGNHIVNKNFVKHAELVTTVPKKISIVVKVETPLERILILRQDYCESKFRNYVSIAHEDFKDLEKNLNK